jgi:hypothetical protein
MRDPLHVTNVSLFPAGRVSRRSGLYGWLTFELNGAPAFDGVTLRRAGDGTFHVGFPASRNGHGAHGHGVGLLDADARQELERQILAELDRQGRLTP